MNRPNNRTNINGTAIPVFLFVPVTFVLSKMKLTYSLRIVVLRTSITNRLLQS